MKQLLILSGKGGTGKTTVASALIAFSHCRTFADCDVDAPNLHMVVSRTSDPVTRPYYGFQKAFIERDKCRQCGLCEKNCRFKAIENYSVGVFECEGCGVCAELCPSGAITMREYSSGDLMLYKNEEQVFSTARLKMGSGASGKLVTAVKQQLKENTENEELTIIDGSPGIGCPVIASISGVSMVLIVAEPTVSGIHDMERILRTARSFGVKCAVCINKYDINSDNTKKIESNCHQSGIPVAGRIPFDSTVINAVNQCRSVADYPDSPAGKAIQSIWETIEPMIFKK